MSAEFATLGSVAEFVNGAAFKPEDWGAEGARIIRIQNLTDPSKPYNRTLRAVDKRLYVEPGDLLVSWSATLGVFEWAGPDVAVLNQHIFRVLPNKSRVDKRFLRHGLERALVEVQRHLHGATMQHVNRQEFLSTRFYLPPLEEQRRIADILDKVDALRLKRRAAATELDVLMQAIFVDMFGDPNSNPYEYSRRPLSSLVREGDTINYGVIQPGEEFEEGVPLIRVGDLADGRVNRASLKRIDPSIERAYKRSRLCGDEVLVTCVGSIGVIALADKSVAGFNIARAVARIPLAEYINRVFVAAYLKTSFVQRYFTAELRTVSQPTLNIKQLSETEIILPPTELQSEFAARAAAVERLTALQCRSLSLFDELFVVLQGRAFRGEL